MGGSDEIDGELAAMLNHMLDDERGVSEVGIEDASEDEDDDEGYETEASCPEIDYLDEEYDWSSKSPEENHTRSTTSPKLEVMVDEDDESPAELIRTLDPGHHLELHSTLLDHLANPKNIMNGLCIKYERFVEAHGLHTIKDEILQALDADIGNLLDQRSVNLEKLKACTKRDAKACNISGAYMHVMYDPNDSEVIGVYIGTCTYVSDRIRSHIKTKGNVVRSKQGLHYRFWNQEGIQDFWIILGTIKNTPFQGGKDRYQCC